MKHQLQTKLEEAGYNVYHNLEKDCLAISFVGLSQKKYIKLGMVISVIDGADKFKSIQIKEKPSGGITQIFYWPTIQYYNCETEIKEFLTEEITLEDVENYKHDKDGVIYSLANWTYINLNGEIASKMPDVYLSAAKETLDSLLTLTGR